jgi:MATE family multidrug resistance protein
MSDILTEARRILTLAWPVAITNLQWIVLNLIDTVLVGHTSTRELGHLSAGRAITYVAIVCSLASLQGVMVFAARADGAGEPGRAGDALRQGLLFAGLLAATALVGLWISADWLMRVAGVPDELRTGGAFYVRMMALAYPPELAFLATSYFLEGISRPRVAMAINLTTLPINAVLAWALIGGHFGLPVLGAGGAAIGTALTVSLAAAAILAYVHLMPDAAYWGVAGVAEPFTGRWRRAWREGAALRMYALAPGISAALELIGFSILIAVSTRFGAATAGAFQGAVAFQNISMAASIGLASAAGVRVGNAIGAGQVDTILRRGLIAAALALGALLCFALLYRLQATALMGMISDDPAVTASGAAMLARLAPWLPFDGLQIVFLFVLRSLGDQVRAGAISILAFFLVMGGYGWWDATHGGGPLGLVDGLIWGMVTAAVLQTGRFVNRARAVDYAGRPISPVR